MFCCKFFFVLLLLLLLFCLFVCLFFVVVVLLLLFFGVVFCFGSLSLSFPSGVLLHVIVFAIHCLFK